MFSALARRATRGALVALGILGLTACGSIPSPSSPPSGAPIPVLGTENFYADLLAQIGGPRVTASSILNDPSADPHAYERSPALATPVADRNPATLNGTG